MPKVKIVTDSAAGLDAETIRRLDITVIPLLVQMDGESFREGRDIAPAELLQRMTRRGSYPTLRAPTADDFLRLYGELAASGADILSLHVSARLKPVHAAAARAAASLLGRQKVEVIDTESIDYGQALIVRAAARAAQAGWDLERIIRLVRGMIPHVYLVFFVDSLDYLERDRRIGVAQAILGAMLEIKPLLTIEDGDLIPMEKVRTRERGIEKLFEFIAEFSSFEDLVILHDRRDDDVRLLQEQLALQYPGARIPVRVYGPSLAAHIGPKAIGAAIYEGAPEAGRLPEE